MKPLTIADSATIILGDAPRTVEYWIRGFEENGLAALREGERSGRPRRLSEKHLRGINTALRRMPRELGLSGNLWDGKTLATWIEREYGIDLGVRQCQRLFRQLGRSEEHTSELQSRENLVCRLLL